MKKKFSLSNDRKIITIGTNEANDVVVSGGGKYFSRFHGVLYHFINNRGIPSIALIYPGSSTGIKEIYSNSLSDRKHVFFLILRIKHF